MLMTKQDAQHSLVFPAGSQPVDTSEDAADSLSAEYLDRVRMDVLTFIASRENGATADEIAAHFKCAHNRTSPRVTELLSLDLIMPCMVPRPDDPTHVEKFVLLRRKTRSGATARVHVVTESGKRLLQRRGRT